ncbi:MAG TPA: chemotaxis-specific protein-glutamate methyltransferase CheB [Rhodocyclaceae bacterium]|nr:chemotaxis-specific protein-glutamate methyltransferase CheB [Rhodocyclaceae bacterium]
MLVVEDSPVVREFLVHVLGADPDISVVGTAQDGEQALEAVVRLSPDVITMDIHMPRVDGIEATRRIMESHPVPIVIVSGSSDPSEVATTFRAMAVGALAVLRRPAGLGHPEHEATVRELVQTVKLMAEVRVVRRWPRARQDAALPPCRSVGPAPARLRAVAIGASTGGPPVLQAMLAALPGDFPAPILIVQHMAAGFIQGFTDWLAQSSNMRVHLATHGETLLPGHVYVAPDNVQMRVTRGDRIVLAGDPPDNGLRPSVAALFRSVAEVYGGEAAACLLTGMGRDGAEELKLLRSKGATTIAQDEASSVVHGMPGAAIRLDAASFVLPPEKIAAALTSLVRKNR